MGTRWIVIKSASHLEYNKNTLRLLYVSPNVFLCGALLGVGFSSSMYYSAIFPPRCLVAYGHALICLLRGGRASHLVIDDLISLIGVATFYLVFDIYGGVLSGCCILGVVALRGLFLLFPHVVLIPHC